MKRATTHFEQVPRVIAEKVLARQTGPPETDVAESDETVNRKVSAAAPPSRSRRVV
jgi:hypothetical protein